MRYTSILYMILYMTSRVSIASMAGMVELRGYGSLSSGLLANEDEFRELLYISV